MVVVSRCLALASVALGATGARIERKQGKDPTTKFIAGVPVLNYNLAYGGASLAELGEDAKQSWVVVAKPGTSDTTIHQACQVGTCTLAGHPSTGGVPFLKIHGSEKDLEDVLDATEGAASFAEPDLEMRVPDDELHTEAAASWGLTQVGVPSEPNQGRGVHVYVLDTGIRVTHQDFGGRAIATLDLTSGSVKECGGSKSCATDAQGHGSHCAGTVGGNKYGVASQTTLHAVKVLSDSGSGSFSWSFSALDWISTSGERPRVASMSLGGQGVLNSMKTAVDSAVSAGIVVVVAGGNSNSDACGFSPAFVPSAITVGSITSTLARSSFSNYGTCTDIWAPGSAITSVGISSDTASATLSGTSMACPHVSGGAAVLLAKSSGMQSSQIISSMLNSAISGAISGLKSGDVNKLLWVGSGAAPSPPPAPVPVTRRRRRRSWS